MRRNVSLIFQRNDGGTMILRAPRFIFFLSIWLMIAGWNPEDLPVGLLTSALALWISVSVLPTIDIRPRLAPLARLSLRFLGCSIMAGADVAQRALSPRMDLRPGFEAVPFALPPGAARNIFLLYQSLQPGTSPTSAEGETFQVHCLDISQPIKASIAADEALFKRAIGHE